jgi:hypothetical protein
MKNKYVIIKLNLQFIPLAESNLHPRYNPPFTEGGLQSATKTSKKPTTFFVLDLQIS